MTKIQNVYNPIKELATKHNQMIELSESNNSASKYSKSINRKKTQFISTFTWLCYFLVIQI